MWSGESEVIVPVRFIQSNLAFEHVFEPKLVFVLSKGLVLLDYLI